MPDGRRFRRRDFGAGKAGGNGCFDGFAFYRVRLKEPALRTDGAHEKSTWRVAHANSNLLMLLGLSVRFPSTGAAGGSAVPEVILSERVWKKEFGADSHVAGTVVQLGNRPVRIGGVVPDEIVGIAGKGGRLEAGGWGGQ